MSVLEVPLVFQLRLSDRFQIQNFELFFQLDHVSNFLVELQELEIILLVFRRRNKNEILASLTSSRSSSSSVDEIRGECGRIKLNYVIDAARNVDSSAEQIRCDKNSAARSVCKFFNSFRSQFLVLLSVTLDHGIVDKLPQHLMEVVDLIRRQEVNDAFRLASFLE